jgi:hypothetical protein
MVRPRIPLDIPQLPLLPPSLDDEPPDDEPLDEVAEGEPDELPEERPASPVGPELEGLPGADPDPEPTGGDPFDAPLEVSPPLDGAGPQDVPSPDWLPPQAAAYARGRMPIRTRRQRETPIVLLGATGQRNRRYLLVRSGFA